MIKLIVAALKISLFCVITLLVSQIPVGSKRICDHVGAFANSAPVTRGLTWVADKFDFTGGKLAKIRAAEKTPSKNLPGGQSSNHSPEAPAADRERVSALLKSGH